MIPVLTPEMAAAADRASVEPVEVLMERAGVAVARVAAEMGAGYGARVVVLVGPGNNGGDGYVAARHLLRRGAAVELHVLEPHEPRPPAAPRSRRPRSAYPRSLWASLGPQISSSMPSSGAASARGYPRPSPVGSDRGLGSWRWTSLPGWIPGRGGGALGVPCRAHRHLSGSQAWPCLRRGPGALRRGGDSRHRSPGDGAGASALRGRRRTATGAVPHRSQVVFGVGAGGGWLPGYRRGAIACGEGRSALWRRIGGAGLPREARRHLCRGRPRIAVAPGRGWRSLLPGRRSGCRRCGDPVRRGRSRSRVGYPAGGVRGEVAALGEQAGGARCRRDQRRFSRPDFAPAGANGAHSPWWRVSPLRRNGTRSRCCCRVGRAHLGDDRAQGEPHRGRRQGAVGGQQWWARAGHDRDRRRPHRDDRGAMGTGPRGRGGSPSGGSLARTGRGVPRQSADRHRRLAARRRSPSSPA